MTEDKNKQDDVKPYSTVPLENYIIVFLCFLDVSVLSGKKKCCDVNYFILLFTFDIFAFRFLNFDPDVACIHGNGSLSGDRIIAQDLGYLVNDRYRPDKGVHYS